MKFIIILLIALSIPEIVLAVDLLAYDKELNSKLTINKIDRLIRAEQGDAEAQFQVGLVYYLGQDATKNYKESFKWHLKAAKQGHTSAQLHVGYSYITGQGVTKDYKEAFRWFLESAEQGNADAQDEVGMMYFHGKGVPRNYTEAYKWFCLSSIGGEEYHVALRTITEKKMTPEQIATGQELATEWQKKHQIIKQ